MTDVLRQLPSVDQLLRMPTVQSLVDEFGHDATVNVIRTVIDKARNAVLAGANPPSREALVNAVQVYFQKQNLRQLQPVINATGVIIHTNLGRAP